MGQLHESYTYMNSKCVIHLCNFYIVRIIHIYNLEYSCAHQDNNDIWVIDKYTHIYIHIYIYIYIHTHTHTHTYIYIYIYVVKYACCLLGINTAIVSPGKGGGNVGVAFAIPAELLHPIVKVSTTHITSTNSYC